MVYAALYARRREADLAAIPPAARGAGFPRSRIAGGEGHAGSGNADTRKRRRLLEGIRNGRGGALHFPDAGPGRFLLRRVYAITGNSPGGGKGDGTEVRGDEVSRLRALAGFVAS